VTELRINVSFLNRKGIQHNSSFHFHYAYTLKLPEVT